MEAHIFKALGDPTRLDIIRRLSGGTPHTVGNLTKGLDITRQAARKQLQVLVSARLVRLVPNGRKVYVRLDMDTLKKGREFIAVLEGRWDARLQKLKRVVEDGLLVSEAQKKEGKRERS